MIDAPSAPKVACPRPPPHYFAPEVLQDTRLYVDRLSWSTPDPWEDAYFDPTLDYDAYCERIAALDREHEEEMRDLLLNSPALALSLGITADPGTW